MPLSVPSVRRLLPWGAMAASWLLLGLYVFLLRTGRSWPSSFDPHQDAALALLSAMAAWSTLLGLVTAGGGRHAPLVPLVFSVAGCLIPVAGFFLVFATGAESLGKAIMLPGRPVFRLAAAVAEGGEPGWAKVERTALMGRPDRRTRAQVHVGEMSRTGEALLLPLYFETYRNLYVKVVRVPEPSARDGVLAVVHQGGPWTKSQETLPGCLGEVDRAWQTALRSQGWPEVRREEAHLCVQEALAPTLGVEEEVAARIWPVLKAGVAELPAAASLRDPVFLGRDGRGNFLFRIHFTVFRVDKEGALGGRYAFPQGSR